MWGLDDIDVTLAQDPTFDAYETKHKIDYAWIS